jgi:hypothetical protein
MMIALYTVGCLYLLWVMYLAVMSLARARDAGTLSTTAKLLGYPLLAVGIVFNVLVNWIILSVLFVEPPRETMFTTRVARHCKYGQGWRKRLACWICHDLLDAFDPAGRHCK